MKLSDIVCTEAIIPQLSSTTRDLSIKELVLSLSERIGIDENKAAQLAKLVIQREKEASTGIGKGVAVPHVKNDQIDEPIAAVGCSQEGIDFSSLDKQPVYTVFLLLSPSNHPDKHLKAMETIFKNLQHDDFRRFLRQAQTREDVMDAIRDADEMNA